ncbi:von Hippel-Lindau disease tumor suppressor-like [Mizuhopecten yessoensis]|uniref:von Hippel-Lindau disease tumor suppressor n=1 Tax=Mizuhopecten yessoensis TaxID=6573 RepID=A0A210PIH5_MIZYE|nr:von Hippel-Lindau disease tumor suppressor-like [Mizuhopecten yessoensis]OWF36284.1 Von Hippel-Lindau disease tumor suppressor [Mizuhopecten yessoensis]
MTGEQNDGSDRQKDNRLRSGRSSVTSFVRFVNRTHRFVDTVWLNYEGARVKYKTLQPGQFVDVNTFVGHPWIFRDSDTGDHMVVQLREVFEMTTGWTPTDGVPPWRKVINITIPVFTLKDRSLQVIRSFVNRDRINELDLPQTLKEEINVMWETTRRRRLTDSPNNSVAESSQDVH